MLLLSDLLRCKVTDRRGATATLVDLVVTLDDVDYPPVSHLIFRAGSAPAQGLPWAEVEALDPAQRVVRVRALDASAAVPLEALDAAAVRLNEAVLDALILDLQGQRVTRANDLWLAAAGQALTLRAADPSVRAVLHRLSGGRWRGADFDAALDWKYAEFLRGVPERVPAGAGYHRRVVRLPSGQIANLSQALPYLHVAELLELLPDRLAADTLERLPAHRRLQVFEEVSDASAERILMRLTPEIAADLVGQMATDAAHRLLNRLPRPAAEGIVELLRYPEDTVGGIMTNRVVRVPLRLTVAEARAALRQQLREPDFVYFVYVVEAETDPRLRGVFSLRDLLLAEETAPLESILNPYLLTLSPLEPAGPAAARVLDSQLVALPVVGAEGRLLGAVTMDAAIAVAAPARWSAQAPRVFS